ncbi:hypothetical protein IWW36_001899 [Coemansia brasiliensis]|uniref:SGF29 C-terminal domain-containing protein n=1 Tax=Coemansia brasiliensis TaxID=2650707 RepID=A0A9W8I822_9FUNG|nr:hypothetical protein IWW36_001899 [Coemansia brasiliensis]
MSAKGINATGLSRGQQRMQELLLQLKTVETARDKQKPLLDNIDKQQAHLASNNDAYNLINDYQAAKSLAQQEQQAADAALEIVNRLLSKIEAQNSDTSGNSEQHNHSKRQKTLDSSTHSIIGKGSLVAARVATTGADEEWILATVLSYDKHRYTVQDYDVESAVRPTYVLSPRYVLFVTADPTTNKEPLWDCNINPEMAHGQRVLALYPRTTAFYQCTVVMPPSQNTAISNMPFPPAPGVPMGSADPALAAPPNPKTNPMYKVQFDDDDNKEVDVPAHLVLPLPNFLSK